VSLVGSASINVPSFCDTAAGSSLTRIPAASLMISVIGQYVIPSPYGRHRPQYGLRVPPSCSVNSASRRDFPTPGMPNTVTSAGRRSATTRSHIWPIVVSCSVRPMSGVRDVWRRDVPGRARAAIQTGTGSALPFAWIGAVSSYSIACAVAR
jgi:hypothetical protein